jgi:uncharacterized membrane protein
MQVELTSKPLLTPFWLIAASFVGLADTLYLSWTHLMGILPTCAILQGCDIVLQSPYAKVFGEPLAYFGLVFYAYLLGIAILLAIDPYSKGLRFGVLVYSAIGVLCSLVFVYLWIFVIHALCIYCVVSAITTAAVFGLALWHYRTTKGPKLSPHTPE